MFNGFITVTQTGYVKKALYVNKMRMYCIEMLYLHRSMVFLRAVGLLSVGSSDVCWSDLYGIMQNGIVKLNFTACRFFSSLSHGYYK